MTVLASVLVALVMVGTAMAQNEVKKLAVANNDFALKMYHQLAKESSENIFISPLSLSSAFAMLYYGAKTRTAEELQVALGYAKAGLRGNEVHAAFRTFLNELSANRDYILSTANSVLIDESLQVDPNYKIEVERLYDALVKDVNFSKNGPQLVAEINTWISSKTNGKIRDLVSRLSSSNVLVLLNAVYFKGIWETPFNPQLTFPDTFYNDGAETKETKVQMMHTKGKFPYAETPEAEILELPYKGDDVSMVVLLPKQRDGLPALEEKLNLETMLRIRSQMQNRSVSVSFPKLKLEYSKELSRQMQNLGAASIFRPGADFAGLTASRNLVVSEIRHKAVLEVNEEGSEAAGATSIFIARTSLVRMLHFDVDHPFLFAIVDNRNDMILFMGSVKRL